MSVMHLKNVIIDNFKIKLKPVLVTNKHKKDTYLQKM